MRAILNKKGFTLIELMVVMAIIAVLAVLIIGAISIARQTATDTQRRGLVKEIQVALESEYAKNNSYPDSAAAVADGGCAGSCGNLAGINGLLGLSLSDPTGSAATSYAICYMSTSSSTYRLRLEPEGNPDSMDNDGLDASCSSSGGETGEEKYDVK